MGTLRLRLVWFLFLVFQLVPMTMLTSPAAAHAAYESSDPGDGASVSSPPSRVTADFTEPVIDESYLQVFDPCGDQVDNGDSLVTADRISVSMSADKAGTYTVEFWVVSSVDGHNTAGNFTFSSSGGDGCVEEEEPVEKKQTSQKSSGGNSGSVRGDASQDFAGNTSGEVTESQRSKSGTDGGRSENARRDADKGAIKSDAKRRKDVPAMADQVAADFGPVEVAQGPDLLEGIPLGAFLVGLSLAALIGAAGGFIYAGIMGYTSSRS